MSGLARRIPAPDIVAAALTGVVLLGHVLVSDDDFLGSGTDLVSMEVPLAAFARHWIEQGVLPLWNPYIAGGVPLPGATAGYFYPLFWAGLLLTLPSAVKLGCALSLGIAGAGGAWLCRAHVESRLASYLGGALFATTGFFVAHLYAGHLELVSAAAFTPWIVGVVERARRGRPVAWGPSVAMFGMALLAAHYQMFLVACLAAAVLVVAAVAADRRAGEAPRARALRGARPLAALGALMVGGALVAAVQVVPLAAVVPFTQRRAADFDFAASFGAVPGTWLSMFLPRLYGPDAALAPVAEFASWEVYGYAGVVTLALAAYAVAALPRARWLAPTVAAGIGAVLAMGERTPLLRILTTLLPPLGRFRAPGRYLVVVALCTSLLAAIGLDALLSPREGIDRRRSLAGPAVVLAAALALASWLGSTDGAAFAHAMAQLAPVSGADGETARVVLERARDDAYLAVLVAGVALGAIVAAAAPARRVSAARVLVALALVDMLHAGQPFLRTGPHAAFDWFAPLADHCRDALGPGGRMLPTPELAAPDVGAPYEIAAPTGYTVLFDDRAARLAKRAAGLPLDSFLGVMQSDGSSPLLRHLGVGLVLTAASRAMPGLGAVHEIGGMGRLHVLGVDAPAPRTALVHAVSVPADEASAYDRMLDPAFDLRDVALLEPGAPAFDLRPPPPGAREVVGIASYAPNEVVLRAEAAAPALAVLSDVYEPGWTARVDGVPAPVVAVDRVMRGVPVAAGTHEVVLRYWPPGLSLGIALSIAGVLLVVALVVAQAKGRWPARAGDEAT